ncbi:acyltransferase family protein [Castellaniella sp. WN]
MKKIKGFDGLRGLAVLLVIISHGGFWTLLNVDHTIFARTLTAELGVTIFFVLSGFLITSLLFEERRVTGTVSLLGFYMRRALRIFPLYFLSLSIAPVLQYMELIRLSNCTYWHAFTYTMNFAPKECVLASYSHFWSLAVEEHFYLIWPLVFLLLRRWALVFMVLVVLICWIVSANGSFWLASFSEKYYINRWSIPAAAPIAIGCIGAYFCNSKYLTYAFDKIGGIILCTSLFAIVYPGTSSHPEFDS